MAIEVRAVEADLPMGMTQVADGEAKVLFIRDDNGIRAFQATCPHYGAPLAKGKICGHTLYCPWHKAAFDVGDGALLEPPALHGLEQYPIRTEGEKIVATLEPMAEARKAPRQTDDRTFVIVGTGAAAVAAAVTLRHEGFGGKLIMVGRETGEPYDRPKLSKNFLAKPTEPAKMALEPGFFTNHGVDFVAGPASKIDVEACTVTLPNGKTLEPDALLVATGSRAVRPSFAGDELGGIHTLRSLEDAVALSNAAHSGRSIVIVGGGFIGLEAAAFLTKRGLSATVVSSEPLPLAARFGDDVAHALKVYHEGTGVRFVQGKVARFEGTGSVRDVRLEGGDTLPADLVLIGVGAAPETGAIEGVAKRDDGGIEVDANLLVAPNVWLAGDIAAFPDRHSKAIARIEHWRLAQQHGIRAAKNMLGTSKPFAVAPFFWSNQGDERLDYAGYAPDWDRIIVHGDIAKLDFIAYYLRDGKALAACAIGQSKNPELIAFLHVLDEGCVPTTEELEGAGLLELV